MIEFKNIILVDGITRSGKFWLANMLIHFDKMEHMQDLRGMDTCLWMNLYGLLSDQIAVKLLQIEIDHHIYEMAIGRNINFRIADSSSIFNNPNLGMYFQRVFGKGISASDIENKINKSNRMFLFIVHDMLCNGRICFEAFPKAKIIRIERNPVDIVYAWYKRNIGKITQDSDFIKFKGKKKPQPWWTYRWDKEYEKFSEMDRILKSIITFRELTKEAFRNLAKIFQKRVLFTSYELLATQPKQEVQKISRFLEAKPLVSMEEFLRQGVFKQRSRQVLQKKRQEKLQAIKKKASDSLFSLLLKQNKQYIKSGYDI